MQLDAQLWREWEKVWRRRLHACVSSRHLYAPAYTVLQSAVLHTSVVLSVAADDKWIHKAAQSGRDLHLTQCRGRGQEVIFQRFSFWCVPPWCPVDLHTCLCLWRHGEERGWMNEYTIILRSRTLYTLRLPILAPKPPASTVWAAQWRRQAVSAGTILRAADVSELRVCVWHRGSTFDPGRGLASPISLLIGWRPAPRHLSDCRLLNHVNKHHLSRLKRQIKDAWTLMDLWLTFVPTGVPQRVITFGTKY